MRLKTLLLAGGTAFCATGASAEPIQPFWLMPSAVATGLGLEKTSAVEQVNTLKAKYFGNQTYNLLTLPEDADHSLDVPMPFSEQANDDEFSVQFRSASLDLEPSVNTKVGHIANALNFSAGDIAAQSVGVDAKLFGGRFAFSSDIIKTVDTQDTRDFRDPQLGERDRTIQLTDTSRRTKFAAKVIDTDNLKLLVDGEFGETSEGFSRTLNELPTGRLVLPGSWSTVSSSLEFGATRVKLDYQDFLTREETLKRQGVTLGYHSSEVSVYRKEGMAFNLTQGGQWLKRTNYTGVTADVMVADVIPSAVADFIDPIRPFLPTSVYATFERGDVVRAELLPGPRDRVDTGNVALTWETNFGETTASVWQRRIKTDVITPDGQDGLNLSRSSDRFIDISHKVRRGNWQFGAGLSLIETDDTLLGVRTTESEYAPHVSIAYAPDDGPKIELRYGAADAQSQILDDNLAARAKAKQLQLSVDVSNFVQDQLNKPDAKLKLEYRYDLNGSDRDPVSGRERGGGHALLVTFSTPLN